MSASSAALPSATSDSWSWEEWRPQPHDSPILDAMELGLRHGRFARGKRAEEDLDHDIRIWRDEEDGGSTFIYWLSVDTLSHFLHPRPDRSFPYSATQLWINLLLQAPSATLCHLMSHCCPSPASSASSAQSTSLTAGSLPLSFLHQHPDRANKLPGSAFLRLVEQRTEMKDTEEETRVEGIRVFFSVDVAQRIVARLRSDEALQHCLSA